jgi:DNA-binding CsgD family transcriptional regulator
LSYLEKGKSSKEMANESFTSPHTIDTHRRNLLKKTNCLNTTGLVTYAKLVGLL